MHDILPLPRDASQTLAWLFVSTFTLGPFISLLKAGLAGTYVHSTLADRQFYTHFVLNLREFERYVLINQGKQSIIRQRKSRTPWTDSLLPSYIQFGQLCSMHWPHTSNRQEYQAMLMPYLLPRITYSSLPTARAGPREKSQKIKPWKIGAHVLLYCTIHICIYHPLTALRVHLHHAWPDPHQMPSFSIWSSNCCNCSERYIHSVMYSVLLAFFFCFSFCFSFCANEEYMRKEGVHGFTTSIK